MIPSWLLLHVALLLVKDVKDEVDKREDVYPFHEIREFELEVESLHTKWQMRLL